VKVSYSDKHYNAEIIITVKVYSKGLMAKITIVKSITGRPDSEYGYAWTNFI
jgi:hypothetical protein